jgi:hypothetical protein
LVHPTVPRVSPCKPTRPTIALTLAPTLAIEGPSVHPTVSFLFLFLLGFDPRKIGYLLNLPYDILASLGPRNVYKDMLNNMFSLNDHVVMNHQNQTRTNGIWGHVRYTAGVRALAPARPVELALHRAGPGKESRTMWSTRSLDWGRREK